jgi:DNA-binding GntR family transcriptional regulator
VSDLGIELDRLSARPIFEQLADALRARILDGRIPPDRKMPTEDAIAKELKVGRSTAARVIAQLRSEGLVVFVPGRGAFTAPSDVIARAKRRKP